MFGDFPALCADGVAAHGRMFWVDGGFGMRQLVIADPAVLDILKNPEISSSYYSEGFATLLGRTLFCLDGEEHRRIRGTMAPAFTPKSIRRFDFVSMVADVARAHVERWVRAGRVAVSPALQALTLEIIMRLMGVPPLDLERWGRQYQRYLLSALPGDTPVHWWARRARDWLDRGLHDILARLRRSGDTTTLVGAVANARDEQGQVLPFDRIVPNVRLLALAGHETSANSLAWAVLHLAHDPTSQRRAGDEVDGAPDLAAWTVDAERFTWAERQFREAMRLYPPVNTILRRVVAPITFADTALPAGTLISVPLVWLLRDPARVPDPERYDPDRFTTRPRPGSIDTVMFGAGPHFCLGYHLAVAEGTLVLLTLARALREAGVRMVPARPGPLPTPVWLPVVHPPRGLAVRFVPA